MKAEDKQDYFLRKFQSKINKAEFSDSEDKKFM